MNRIVTTMMLMLLAAALLGCGGGGTGAPLPDGGNPPSDENPVITPLGPSEVVGSHSTSVLPDQLNVLTGAPAAELSAQLGRFGISVLNKSGGWATVELPAGMDLDWAARELEKEYNIATVEKVNLLQTPRVRYEYPQTFKAPSYMPFDPMFTYAFIAPAGTQQFFYSGQEVGMDIHGFEGAWEVGLSPGVAGREVRIAIVGAGFWPEATLTGWPTAEDNMDATFSGAVAGDGTVTVGLDQVTWELYEDTIYDQRDEPYDDAASIILGMLADDIGDPVAQTGFIPRYFDFDGEGDVDEIEIWNTGIAGMNPSADFILLKTGQASGDTWTYSDNQIAEAIKYAAGATADDNGGLWPNGGCEADIIILAMFAEGPVGGVILTETQAARDNNALVIAPAGDVVDQGISGEPPTWNAIPVDIGVTPVTPAADPNVIAVSATGAQPTNDIGEVIIDEVSYENPGFGWYPQWADFLKHSTVEVATTYANSGGDIAAVGFGIGWRFDSLFQFGDGTEEDPLQYAFYGYNYQSNLDRFGSLYSTAYVAGAASIVHQALHEANNAEPSDDDVWQVLVDTMRFGPMTGIVNNGGLLNAAGAALNAIEGGTLYQPSMYLEGIVVSQIPSYVEIETDFEVTPTVQLGTAPFTIRIDWDNGEDQLEEAWDNGNPVTLTGGWDTLGQKGINIEIEDTDGQLVTFALWIHVVGRLSAGITINDVNGALILPSTLQAGLNYRFNANPVNVYTGEIDGEPNVTSFSWDFDGDGTEDATGVSPAYGYPASGDYTLELTVTETIRPSILFTMDVNVN